MKTIIRKTCIALLLLFLILNTVAYIHAYKFTHFSSSGTERTKDPKELSTINKLRIVFAGIDNPRPENKMVPPGTYERWNIQSDVLLEGWFVPRNASLGTVILFHGYSGDKSQLIERASYFNELGYNTLLVDFKGSGGSEGSETSIGFHEAAEVKDCYDHVSRKGEKNIHLFGTSMGAASILKAVDNYGIQPSSIILECPFGTLSRTVEARFKMMGLPPFPMASILSFWGGVQQGYWAFAHNPQEYAKSVTSPTLILFGESDDRVSMEEIQTIFQNLKGKKVLATYPGVGHAIYTSENESNWKKDVTGFLREVESL